MTTRDKVIALGQKADATEKKMLRKGVAAAAGAGATPPSALRPVNDAAAPILGFWAKQQVLKEDSLPSLDIAALRKFWSTVQSPGLTASAATELIQQRGSAQIKRDDTPPASTVRSLVGATELSPSPPPSVVVIEPAEMRVLANRHELNRPEKWIDSVLKFLKKIRARKTSTQSVTSSQKTPDPVAIDKEAISSSRIRKNKYIYSTAKLVTIIGAPAIVSLGILHRAATKGTEQLEKDYTTITSAASSWVASKSSAIKEYLSPGTSAASAQAEEVEPIPSAEPIAAGSTVAAEVPAAEAPASSAVPAASAEPSAPTIAASASAAPIEPVAPVSAVANSKFLTVQAFKDAAGAAPTTQAYDASKPCTKIFAIATGREDTLKGLFERKLQFYGKNPENPSFQVELTQAINDYKQGVAPCPLPSKGSPKPADIAAKVFGQKR